MYFSNMQNKRCQTPLLYPSLCGQLCIITLSKADYFLDITYMEKY